MPRITGPLLLSLTSAALLLAASASAFSQSQLPAPRSRVLQAVDDTRIIQRSGIRRFKGLARRHSKTAGCVRAGQRSGIRRLAGPARRHSKTASCVRAGQRSGCARRASRDAACEQS